MISWLAEVGRSISPIRRQSLISDTKNFVPDFLWLQDCNNSHLWTSLTVRHRTMGFEPQQEIVPHCVTFCLGQTKVTVYTCLNTLLKVTQPLLLFLSVTHIMEIILKKPKSLEYPFKNTERAVLPVLKIEPTNPDVAAVTMAQLTCNPTHSTAYE